MNNLKTIDMLENDSIKVEIVTHESLSGSKTGRGAKTIYYQEKAGIKLKNVKITLKGGSVAIEAGALYFMKGNIEVKSAVGKGFMKNLGTSLLSGEKLFKPEYTGTGEIWLEPSFGHYAIVELEDDEIIVDKGLFYACQNTLEVSAVSQKNISSALFGGEGLFQTRIKGSGIAVLSIPVPQNELIIYKLEDDTLSVDGNFAILRKGKIDFTVKPISKGLGTMASGEGLVQTFKGTGEVWLAPTQIVYELLDMGYPLSSISGAGSSNTKTK
ncbi:protein of unknown function DUF124 [Methanococcus vannielii SB]|jgi:uncharacterized protein (AIM24 family)|uniref:Transcriptional regulator n=1 Tax=Methanococcus vannielii (strain ATCC 35089 / DSM 1224 / JCM 13029 / OCM 148 / SB) TaxID=406327 RepID=A6URI6_METVS|nr:AIM24 family protein [Methanococcus vannielii]ABR55108.1 protein of unknown function DUF124 [Methanococcus vannielii SB]